MVVDESQILRDPRSVSGADPGGAGMQMGFAPTISPNGSAAIFLDGWTLNQGSVTTFTDTPEPSTFFLPALGIALLGPLAK
jgi:hypothetical protein